nr:MAG TPA: terminase small subunit [Caudoviricetes sp.]
MSASLENATDGNSPLRNVRHEAFAQAVAGGKTSKDAYKEVYACKDSTARREGSKLSTNPLVRARVRALQSQNSEVQALTRAKKREILAAIAVSSNEDSRARIAAIQEDNRMTGEAEERFNFSGAFSLKWGGNDV